MPGQFELAVRVAVFVMLAPTLSFLGLGRLLEAMRDDELVERVQAEDGPAASPARSPVDLVGDVASGTGESGVASGTGESGVVCRACGATNAIDATFCQRCLRELPDE